MSSNIDSLVGHAIHFLGYRPDIINISKEVLIEGANEEKRLEVADAKFLAVFYTEKSGCSVETPKMGPTGITYASRDEFPVTVYVFNCDDLGINSVSDGLLMARSISSDGTLEPVIGRIAEDFFEQTINGATYCCCKVIDLPENEQDSVIDVMKKKGIDLHSPNPIYGLINS